MTALIVLTALLVALTVGVSISTARELARLKARLTRLIERRQECRDDLASASEYRKSIEGTRDLLNSVLATKQEQYQALSQQLIRLQAEADETLGIHLGQPLARADSQKPSE